MSTLSRLDSDLDLQTAILAAPEDDYEEFLTRCFHYSPKSADEPISRKKNDLDVFKQRLSMRGMSMKDLFEKRMSRKFSADVDFDLCTTIDDVREMIKREETRTSTESGITDSDNHSDIAKHVEQATPLVSVSVDNTVVESFAPVETIESESQPRGSMDVLHEELFEQSMSSITMDKAIEAAAVPSAVSVSEEVALKTAAVKTAAAASTAVKKGAATVTRSATTVKEPATAPKPPSISAVGRTASVSAAAVPPRPPMVKANTMKAPAAAPAANKGPAEIARAALMLTQKNSAINKSTTKIASSASSSASSSSSTAASSAVSKPAGPKRTSSGIMGDSSSSYAAGSGLKRSNSANKVTRPGLAAAGNTKASVKFNASEAMAH
jgi:hypothetical protein